jgi:hypothetical protein
MSDPVALNGAHSHRSEVVLGYLLQVSSAALLLAQHFALPVFLGMADYGRMATLVGAASLLSVGYDHGYNLLVVRKHRLAWHYLAIKVALLSVACLGAGIWAWAVAAGVTPGAGARATSSAAFGRRRRRTGISAPVEPPGAMPCRKRRAAAASRRRREPLGSLPAPCGAGTPKKWCCFKGRVRPTRRPLEKAAVG